MNDILSLLVNGMRNGNSPEQMLAGMAQGNPAIAQVLSIVRGKNPAQLEQTARNMARERGIDLDELARNMGFR